MEKEELKTKVDFNNIREVIFIDPNVEKEYKTDYLYDDKGNNIIPLSVLEFKLIEKIKALEERIKVLEGVKIEAEK